MSGRIVIERSACMSWAQTRCCGGGVRCPFFVGSMKGRRRGACGIDALPQPALHLLAIVGVEILLMIGVSRVDGSETHLPLT